METLPAYITGFFAIVLFTSFVKILVTLNVLRFGIGLKGGAFGLAIVGASVALSLLVMSPQIDKAGGIKELLGEQDPAKIEANFRPFLEKQCHPDVLQRFSALRARLTNTQSGADANLPASINVLIPAFMVSELTEAFQVGFLLLVPFLVIDLIAVNVLMVLGVTQLSVSALALPLKILVFFAVDGWSLLSEKLVAGYL